MAGVKLSAIVEAIGMSKDYASQIRAGKWTPHVSTWPALARLAGVPTLRRATSPSEVGLPSGP
jgi:hypothetical protein